MHLKKIRTSKNRAKQEVELSWTPELFGPVFKYDNETLQQVMFDHLTDKRARSLVAMVPDEIVYTIELTKKYLREFVGVLLLANVPGFTALCEKYNNTGNGGILGLTLALNSYIGTMIEAVYACGGDVLKFSGSGLLAVWKVRKNELIFNTIHEVIVCALRIQDTRGSSRTNVNLLSRAKMAVSAGNLIFSVIGDESARRFIVAGSPLTEVKMARRTCLKGDLLLTRSAWSHCTPCNYEYVIKDAYNVKVTKVIEHPIEHRERIRGQSVTLSVLEDTSKIEFDEQHTIPKINSKIYTGRVSVTEAAKRKLGMQLKTFVVKPLTQQIDMDRSLEYLTEARIVTAVSIGLIVNKCSVYKLVKLVDESFRLLHRLASEHTGCIDNVSLYEKDVMFLVLFGLRGFDSKDICGNGLTCASQMLSNLKCIVGVQNVSIGIATGMVYCSVIGHSVRRQYTIIGSTVNKAIRIMSTSIGKVTCEFDTLFHSHLPKCKFVPQGSRDLKGIGMCQIYKFVDDLLEAECCQKLSDLEYTYPLLGRFREMDLFMDVLDDIGMNDRTYSGLLVKGRSRIGKSRLLDAFVTIIKSRQVIPVKYILHPSCIKKSHTVVQEILAQILEASDFETVEERERRLMNQLKHVQPDDLCYLNTLMRVRFRVSKKYCSMSEWSRHVKALQMFDGILKMSNIKRCILLDNVQYMDFMSWQYLSLAMKNANVMLVMTMLESNELSKIGADICDDKRLLKYTMTELEPGFVAALACQFLNVCAISNTLETILTKHSANDPGWCESFLTLVLQGGGLDFVKITPNEALGQDLVFPAITSVTKIPADVLPEEVAPPLSWKRKSEVLVCLTNQRFDDCCESLTNVDDILVELYARLTPYEQGLLKSAAILGTIFTRNLLQIIMPNPTALHTARAVANMIDLRILECGSIQRPGAKADNQTFRMFKKRRTFSDMQHLVQCYCYVTPMSLNKNLPAYSHCKLLEFKVSAFRQMLSEQVPPAQKKEFHIKAVDFYEKVARKCPTCGEGPFLKYPVKERSDSIKTTSPRIAYARRRSVTDDRDHDVLAEKKKKMRKRSILSVSNSILLERESNSDLRKICILPTSNEMDSSDDVSKISLEEPTTNDRPCNERSRFRKNWLLRILQRSTIEPYVGMDPSHGSQLKIFSNVDFRTCQCNIVIDFLFSRLLYHVENAEQSEKHIRFLMEYGAGLILTAQSAYAVELLAIAEEKNEAIPADKESTDFSVEERISNKGVILSLIGDAHVELGNFQNAKKYYKEAMGIRNSIFRRTELSIFYRTFIEKWHQKIYQEFPGYFINRKSDERTLKKLNMAFFMRQLSTVFMFEERHQLSELTALKSLNVTLTCSTSFTEQSRSYSTAITAYRQSGRLRTSRRLEEFALSNVARKTLWTNVEEIVAAADVYLSVFQTRLLRGELERALDVGFKVLRISGGLRMTRTRLLLLPLLIQVTMQAKRIHETMDLIRELSFIAEEDVDKSAITWYYALCLDLLLDTGLILETFETCLAFSQESLKACKSGGCVTRDPDSLKRLLTSVWIWQLRMGFLITTDVSLSLDSYIKDNKHDNYSHIITVCKALECHLLSTTRCINLKKAAALLQLRKNIESLVTCLNDISKISRFVKPRLYLLKSYLNIVRGRRRTARKYLTRAEKYAKLQGNKMIIAWIEQNKRTWQDKYNNMAQYWVEHVGYGQSIDWQDIHMIDVNDWSTLLYPLPIPDACL